MSLLNHCEYQQKLLMHTNKLEQLAEIQKQFEDQLKEYHAIPFLKKLFKTKTNLDDPEYVATTKQQTEAKIRDAKQAYAEVHDAFHLAMHMQLSTTSPMYKSFLSTQKLYGELTTTLERYEVALRTLLQRVGIARNTMAVSSNANSNTYSETATQALKDWYGAYLPTHLLEAELHTLADKYIEAIRGTPFNHIKLPPLQELAKTSLKDIMAMSYVEKRKLLEGQKGQLEAFMLEVVELRPAITHMSRDFDKILSNYRHKKHQEALDLLAKG